jgi:AcrR family transcriptional regulator
MPRPPVSNERRAQILDGLFEAMASQGSDLASVTEIAQRSGLPRGALHYYFKNKDEMRRALMQRMGDRYLKGLRRAAHKEDGTTPHPDALARMVRYHLMGDLDYSERLLSVWIDFWGQSPGDPVLARIVQEVQQSARDMMGGALAAAGCPLRGPELEARALVAVAITEGMMLQWRVGRIAGRNIDIDRTLAAAVAAVERIAREVA